MILYGSSLSPYVRKVLVVAAEKGIELQLDSAAAAPGQQSEEFKEASPLGKMPAFRDEDYVLADSSAIIHYLEAKYPERPMIPADPKLRGRTIWFEEYADTVMMACGAKIFFNRVVAPTFLGRPGDLAAADAAERDELPPIRDYLERVAPEGDGYLVGDELTLADIAIAGPFATLGHVGLAIDAAEHPRLAAFIARMHARPSFAHWIERERALLERVRSAA
jgi:glutathione S-transferase